jgi:hypothetical protein
MVVLMVILWLALETLSPSTPGAGSRGAQETTWAEFANEMLAKGEVRALLRHPGVVSLDRG